MLVDFLGFGTLFLVASFVHVLWPLALIGAFAIVDGVSSCTSPRGPVARAGRLLVGCRA
jgi:hypothetical protein